LHRDLVALVEALNRKLDALRDILALHRIATGQRDNDPDLDDAVFGLRRHHRRETQGRSSHGARHYGYEAFHVRTPPLLSDSNIAINAISSHRPPPSAHSSAAAPR